MYLIQKKNKTNFTLVLNYECFRNILKIDVGGVSVMSHVDDRHGIAKSATRKLSSVN